MTQIDRAMELAIAEYRKEFGEDAKLEEGDEFATVFDDGVLVVMRDDGIKIKALLGAPYTVREAVFGALIQESEEKPNGMDQR